MARFINDYWDMINLGDLTLEHIGMIDAIVASRGQTFAGTYYSTFTGYINRMRGYHGHSKYTSFYSWNPQKFTMQDGKMIDAAGGFSREYPIGWYVNAVPRFVSYVTTQRHYFSLLCPPNKG